MRSYPSLTEWGRQRVQLNSSLKREIVKDFFVGLNVFDSYDSAPPNPDAAHNDIGVVHLGRLVVRPLTGSAHDCRIRIVAA